VSPHGGVSDPCEQPSDGEAHGGVGGDGEQPHLLHRAEDKISSSLRELKPFGAVYYYYYYYFLFENLGDILYLKVGIGGACEGREGWGC